jgi:hypothetical protein
MYYYEIFNTVDKTYSETITVPPSKVGYSAVIKIKAQIGESVVLSRSHLYVEKTFVSGDG